MSSGTSSGLRTRPRTILVIAPCYDEPRRMMGSVVKISRQLSKYCRVVVFTAGSSDRVESRSRTLKVYFVKELVIPDPVNNGPVPRMFSKLKRVLRREKPDLVLNIKHMFYPNLAAPWLAKRGYTVVTATDTFPGYIWLSASPIVNAVLWLYARTLGKLVLKKSDLVILFHEGLIEQAEKLKLRYTVIHNGVELELVKKAKPKHLAGKINVLYVGRLESVKGYTTIFEAMAQVTKHHSQVHFYYIGDDAGRESFKLHYKSRQIHFEGRKSMQEVYGYMKAADINVLASRSEGLPNVLMEGMAAGCVGVSTNVGAVPYLFEHGKLGRTFEYNDAAGLEKQVEWLIAHPKERAAMAAKGKQKVISEYDWEKLGKLYFEALCAE